MLTTSNYQETIPILPTWTQQYTMARCEASLLAPVTDTSRMTHALRTVKAWRAHLKTKTSSVGLKTMKNP